MENNLERFKNSILQHKKRGRQQILNISRKSRRSRKKKEKIYGNWQSSRSLSLRKFYSLNKRSLSLFWYIHLMLDLLISQHNLLLLFLAKQSCFFSLKWIIVRACSYRKIVASKLVKTAEFKFRFITRVYLRFTKSIRFRLFSVQHELFAILYLKWLAQDI